MTVLSVPTSSSAFSVRHFGAVWASGLLWHVCRWAVAFLGAYLINDMTGSPRLTQLAGTFLYAPLLVGGVVVKAMCQNLGGKPRCACFIGIASMVRSEKKGAKDAVAFGMGQGKVVSMSCPSLHLLCRKYIQTLSVTRWRLKLHWCLAGQLVRPVVYGGSAGGSRGAVAKNSVMEVVPLRAGDHRCCPSDVGRSLLADCGDLRTFMSRQAQRDAQ